MMGLDRWLDELADILTLRAEYYFYQSTDIELDRGKFKHLIKQDIIEAISKHNIRMTKILFRIPVTRYFLAYCRDEKYQWFSLYRKEFG